MSNKHTKRIIWKKQQLAGGFKYTPGWGNDLILTNIFQMGWNHQPEFAWS